MFDDQNPSSFSTLAQAATAPPHQEVSGTQDADPGSRRTTAPSWSVHHDGTRALTYCDYYCLMSLVDYLNWIEKSDGSGPPISFSAA
jgi:hypothetical protein